MKTKLIALAIGVICWTSSKSQISSETKGFSVLKLNYNLSFISDDPFTTNMGFGIGTEYFINEKFSVNFNLVIKPTRKEIEDFDFIGDWIVSRTHTHQEFSAFFMDIPIHVNYNLFNFKSFSFSLSAGPRLLYLNTSRELIRTTDNLDPFYYNEERNNINLGLDIGFVQKFAISKRLGLFSSQHYGQALLGYSNGFESTDLDFGITYKIK